MTDPQVKRFYRTNVTDAKLGGVCGGIAKYTGNDPTLVRILWVVVTLLSVGLGLIAYVVFWIAAPGEDRLQTEPTMPKALERTLTGSNSCRLPSEGITQSSHSMSDGRLPPLKVGHDAGVTLEGKQYAPIPLRVAHGLAVADYRERHILGAGAGPEVVHHDSPKGELEALIGEFAFVPFPASLFHFL